MPEVKTNPQKLRPPIKPPGNEGESGHPNAPVRLRSTRKTNKNRTRRNVGRN